MKRDWDLLRRILDKVQECEAGKSLALSNMMTSDMIFLSISELGEIDREQVYEHILLLRDANLIETEKAPRNFGSSRGIIINRLTMEGHDFLDLSQDNNRWKAAKDKVAKIGGAATVTIFTQLLLAELKNQIGL